jgi:hypothetical protein
MITIRIAEMAFHAPNIMNGHFILGNTSTAYASFGQRQSF